MRQEWVLSGSDIFREKINNCLDTSDMQSGDELHCLIDSGELYSTLHIVLYVSEGDGAWLSHESVSNEWCGWRNLDPKSKHHQDPSMFAWRNT